MPKKPKYITELEKLIDAVDVTNSDPEKRLNALWYSYLKENPRCNKERVSQVILDSSLYSDIRWEAYHRLIETSQKGLTENAKRNMAQFHILAEYMGGKCIEEFNAHHELISPYLRSWESINGKIKVNGLESELAAI